MTRHGGDCRTWSVGLRKERGGAAAPKISLEFLTCRTLRVRARLARSYPLSRLYGVQGRIDSERFSQRLALRPPHFSAMTQTDGRPGGQES